ncbi:MAG TPA: BsuPI-related putative proteinase inhibitor [Gemmatimonadota bacterium]|nr:BsuPI-related putative proteinase inhibitor [Gemmatimonadota bacterium]
MRTRDGFRASLPIAMLAVALGATCGDQTTPTPLDPGGNLTGSIVRDGIEYRAEVLVMESFPVQLSGRATIRNASSEPRTVTFPDGCVALMRAYRPQGGGPVWDQAHEIGCTMALVPVELAPGEERTVPTPTASAYEILGTDLPDGDYRITVYLRPIDAGEVEIDAGTTDLAIPR